MWYPGFENLFSERGTAQTQGHVQKLTRVSP